MTSQAEFGGAWTQRKLEALSKYLRAYTTLFKGNRKAQFYSISYVDAFAGTGTLRRPELGGLAEYLPELKENEKGFRKGSVRRALEVDPPFDRYVFIENDARKCRELETTAADYPHRHVTILNEDANAALPKWCERLDTERERAVVFLDPFGASVEWRVIAQLGRTKAVDLWVLFPNYAINRMLARHRTPSKALTDRLTSTFGTADWETTFYSKSAFRSLLSSAERVEVTNKTADHRVITDFFVKRLQEEFVAVSNPLPMHNSRSSLLFTLFFAAANSQSAKTGLKIANDIIRKLASS